MDLSPLLNLLRDTSDYQSLLSRLRAASRERVALNLLGASRAYLLATLHGDYPQHVLTIAPKAEHALQLYRQLSAWTGASERVLYFPEPDNLPYERATPSLDARQNRLSVLQRLSDPAAPPQIVVTCARALMQQTLAPQHFREATQLIRRDESHPLHALLARWQQYGYEAVTIVEQRGQFSHRGGVVDVWSPASDLPVRMEFFGDEIDSIRRFDLVSQRSREPLDEVLILPASEALPQFGVQAAQRLEPMLERAALSDAARREFESDLDDLRANRWIRHLDLYLRYLEAEPCSLLDYLPADTLIVSDDAQQIEAAAREWTQEVESLQRDAVARSEVPADFAAPIIAWEQIAAGLRARPQLDFAFGLIDTAFGHWDELFHTPPRYGGKLLNAIEDWQTRLKAADKLVIVSRQAERIAELLRERGSGAQPRDSVSAESFNLLQGVLAEGFELASVPPLVLLSDAEIFGYARPEPRRPSEKRSTPMESYYADLSVGDYVVHIEHGIARYAGLVRRDFHGAEREYLQLEYAGGDKLYVPVDQADRVARYVGSGETVPVVHRLGTADWESAKAKAKRAVEDIAEDLMLLYAERAKVPGHAFGGDTNWQQELEESFPYVETPDQLRALAAIKQDMESDRPMDRLVCGDVGYGKTEVALRAAFKAVMDGKQVGILVPTTVLAEQHLKTFQARLKPFPVEIEMLSRFRTQAQQKKILERLATGGVDILIGTHRLLQDDVIFKDLGLLIIDEEQRFGVKAKEKLKQLRTEVDVLTLTATPIPRTLNMALMGARDMSTIDTPPEERRPIRTYVSAYDEATIKQAIVREISRGGQVFFVHNRIQGIEQVMARIKRLVPEARVTCGHGQMRERELERVMSEFAEGKYDVLISTAIIESGIDLPNVNTIIINQADQFGLSDLYQLRGRVGRSPKQAYAYLLYSRDKVLSGDARKRLQAIFEASELGAGFKIAMRDLEIRGAGDILGARQHGQIAAIGFDLYTRLLAQAVREKREQLHLPRSEETEEARQLTTPPAITLNLPLEAHLPKDYVPAEDLRLRLYRRMAELNTVEAIDDFARELADRFGALPEAAQNLLFLLRIKALAARIGADSVVMDGERIVARVRNRVVLLEWRPSSELERVVSIARNTFSIPLARNGEQAQSAWMGLLERAMRELAEVAS